MKSFFKYRDYVFNDGWLCRISENPKTRRFDTAPDGIMPLGEYVKKHNGVKNRKEGIIFY